MAYTTIEFYSDSYFGDVLDINSFPRWAERASDFVDTITFKRLVYGLPANEWQNKRVQKCVCAIADAYYLIDMAQKNAIASAEGNVGGSDGSAGGGVKSLTSGNQSITYFTSAELSSGSRQWSAAFAAAANKSEEHKFLLGIAKEYLSGVTTDDGTFLLYAGV